MSQFLTGLMEDKGAKKVAIALTALFSCTLSDKFSSTTGDFAGKTPACLPKAKVPDDRNEQ